MRRRGGGKEGLKKYCNKGINAKYEVFIVVLL
jgi:hypothetical protein